MFHETDTSKKHLENPFRVPEGYFDTIADRVMEAIPQNEVKMVHHTEPKKRPAWRVYAAAAAIAAVIFGAGIYSFNKTSDIATQPVQASAETSYTATDDAEFDAVANYIMCDDYDLYAYLSSE